VAEKKLDLNTLEVRGIFMLQASLLEAKKQAEGAAKQLEAIRAQVAVELKGKLPDGVVLEQVRIDQQKSEAWVPVQEEPPKA